MHSLFLTLRSLLLSPLLQAFSAAAQALDPSTDDPAALSAARATLFALLAIGHLVDNEGIVHVAGWIGLVCGASAIYLAMGEVLNEQFDRTILPIGEKH